MIANAISKLPPSISRIWVLNRFRQNPIEYPNNEFKNVIKPIAIMLNRSGLFVRDRVMPAENASILVAKPISNSIFPQIFAFFLLSVLNASFIKFTPRYVKIMKTIHFA